MIIVRYFIYEAADDPTPPEEDFATAGVIFGTLDWRLWLICLLSFVICVVITRYVSLGSLIVVTLLFASFVTLGMTGNIMNPITDKAYMGNELIESYVILFLFAALAFDNLVL